MRMTYQISVLVLGLLVGPVSVVPAPAQEWPLVGISLNVPSGGGPKEIVRDITALKALGARVMCVSYKWSALEPAPGQINLKPIEDAIGGLALFGFRIALTIQTIDTNNRTLPPDLQDKPFDDPAMRRRFEALLAAISAKLSKNVEWVMLGNEVDIYLAGHPNEVEPFGGMVDRGRMTLRALRPGLAVGVTATYDGARRNPSIVRRVDRTMDVAAITYYPLKPDFTVRPVTDVDGDFARMVQFAGGKPLLIQEAGYPADPLLASSDRKQADFVTALFAAARRHAGGIRIVNFFLMYDFSDELLDIFVKYYRVPDPRFRAFLATLGLKRADGTPREAWSRFESGLRAWSATPK